MEIPKLAGLLKHDTVAVETVFGIIWRIGMYSGDEAYDCCLALFRGHVSQQA